MAQSRRSSRGFPGRSARRRVGWDIGPGDTGIASIGATGRAILGSGAQVLEDGLTVVRIRGDVLMYLSAFTAQNDGFDGALGIGITDVTAFGIGITAVQTPLVDETWDGWLWHQYFSIRGNMATPSLNLDRQAFGCGARAFVVDTKAMRKLTEDSVIYACVDVVMDATATMKVTFNSRALYKLA